jgi:hypothetical protein
MNCPELPDYDISRKQSAEEIFKDSPVLHFNQSWLPSPTEGFCSGEVRIGWSGDRFCFDAKLEDSRIFTDAKKRNEMLYLLGDTLEFFAGVENDPSYVEYHYAPNSVILQLLWPRPLATIDLKSSGGVEAFAILEDSSKHKVQSISGGWRVSGQVKLPRPRNSSQSLAGVAVDLHFGRYDYSGSDSKPVLSSTSPLPRASFHDRENWRRVVCQRGTGH